MFIKKTWGKIGEYDRKRQIWRGQRQQWNQEDAHDNNQAEIKKVLKAIALWTGTPADCPKFNKDLNKLDNKGGIYFTDHINVILRGLFAQEPLPENLQFTINNLAANDANPTQTILTQLYRNFLITLPALPVKFRVRINEEFNECGTTIDDQRNILLMAQDLDDAANLDALRTEFSNKIRNTLTTATVNHKITQIAEQKETSYKFTHKPGPNNNFGNQIPNNDALISNAQQRMNDMLGNNSFRYQRKTSVDDDGNPIWSLSNKRGAMYTTAQIRKDITKDVMKEIRSARITFGVNNDNPGPDGAAKLKARFLKKLPKMRQGRTAPIENFTLYAEAEDGGYKRIGEPNQSISKKSIAGVAKVTCTLKSKASVAAGNDDMPRIQDSNAVVEYIPKENKFTLITQRGYEENEETIYDTIRMMCLSGITVLDMSPVAGQPPKMPEPNKAISIGKFGVETIPLQYLVKAIGERCFRMRVEGIEYHRDLALLNNIDNYINGIRALEQRDNAQQHGHLQFRNLGNQAPAQDEDEDEDEVEGEGEDEEEVESEDEDEEVIEHSGQQP